jgi:serine O-acetyltransferase
MAQMSYNGGTTNGATTIDPAWRGSPRPKGARRAIRNPLSPEMLWRASHALDRRFHRIAMLVQKLNTILYHNSLPPTAYGSGVRFGHCGFGTVIHPNVRFGKEVKIWHNVTISVHATYRSRNAIVIEDGVRIGANSVVIAPEGRTIRIGHNARIGAGALVVSDVPAGATVVAIPSEHRLADQTEADPQLSGLD